ncbi:ABC transporter substrate-binding protein [Streptomyces sp. NPDC059785]|uniref:ABC transporter substrate-binding protein n=1 Tax=Streptomyces sp. NPDC059785 TaxID=3346945 RepID=UPI003664D665
MRYRKPFGAMAVAVASALLLSACSGGTGVGDAKQDDKADKGLPVLGKTVTWDPNQLVNDGRPIKLEWWAWAFVDEAQKMADAYQKVHPNVDIQVVNQPWDDYWTKLPLALQGSGGPAIFNVHNSQHDNLVKYMAPYDIPVKDLQADFTNVDQHVIDGKVYYIDFGLMTGAIFYNKDMWKKAGLTQADIPETWDEFREVAKKLTVRDGGKITQAGFNFNGQYDAIQSGMAYQLGQNLFAGDLKTPDVDNAANLEVIERFLDIYRDGSGDKDLGSGGDTFGQGLTAMTYSWGHLAGTLKTDHPDLDWGVFRTPVPEAGKTPYAFDRTNGESTIGINKNASPEEQAVAQDFLRYYLTNEDAMKQLCLAVGVYPTYKPLADDPDIKASPVLEAFGDSTKYIWPGALPATFQTSLVTMWEDILYNGVSPRKALATAQKTLSTDLKGSGFVSVENRYPGYQAQDD